MQSDESLQLFQNPPLGVKRTTNSPAKCLMDCVMREMGVVSMMIILKALKYLNIQFK